MTMRSNLFELPAMFKREFVLYVLAQRGVLLALILSVSWTGIGAQQIENPRFAPNERSLVFDYCQNSCGFIIYSIADGLATSFAKPANDSWILPSFSPSSDSVVFIVSTGPGSAQVATAKLDGSEFRIITTSSTVKRSPSFSRDGTQVIFAGKDLVGDVERGIGFSDVYVVDLASRQERRVSDLRALGVGAPFFMPDGAHFVISMTGSARPRSGFPVQEIDVEKLFPNRKVFVLPISGDQTLNPLVRDLSVAMQPMPLRNGEVAVLSRVNEVDGIRGPFVHDIFLASAERTRRHTYIRRYIRSYGISESGKLLSFVTGVPRERYTDSKLMLWRKSTGDIAELKIANIRLLNVRH